jgi:hypothetical protein
MFRQPARRRPRAHHRRFSVLVFVLAAAFLWWYFNRDFATPGSSPLNAAAPAAARSLDWDDSADRDAQPSVDYDAALVLDLNDPESPHSRYWKPRPSRSGVATPGCPDNSGPELPESIDLTIFTSTKQLDDAQRTAVRSWLALGASVIVMLDHVGAGFAHRICTTSGLTHADEPWRLRVIETPRPRSLTGAPRMDLVFALGQQMATTAWLTYSNGDIVLPRTFAKLLALPGDALYLGARLDCRPNPALHVLPPWVASFEDFEKFAMAPCWPHGAGGKDFFTYRRGFWERHGIALPPFWVGKFVWDNWIVNVTRHFAVDTTPALAIGHFSHNGEYQWGKNRTQKELASEEIEFNRRLVNCSSGLIYRCLPSQSVYDVSRQLCPDWTVRPMPLQAGKLYDRAYLQLRKDLKPFRRVYQNRSALGASPSYWYDQMLSGEWGRTIGCA